LTSGLILTTAGGSQEQAEAPELLIDDDIDPADFFDPEEFGYRRRASSAARP
jgi:hypothetical protein